MGKTRTRQGRDRARDQSKPSGGSPERTQRQQGPEQDRTGDETREGRAGVIQRAGARAGDGKQAGDQDRIDCTGAGASQIPTLSQERAGIWEATKSGKTRVGRQQDTNLSRNIHVYTWTVSPRVSSAEPSYTRQQVVMIALMRSRCAREGESTQGDR
ncbi:hypothetical protein NQD34_016806 [Periophthalmus magnuspinnatus]|nr:hypothetical protein NQD34_016806 [Periophthalmus magnuspinnatus]